MSKELEALKNIQDALVNSVIYKNLKHDECPDTVEWVRKTAGIEIIETALKRLEIIKEKEVNVFIFLHSGDLETYNDIVEDNRKLTQEEYDVLKEISDIL